MESMSERKRAGAGEGVDRRSGGRGEGCGRTAWAQTWFPLPAVVVLTVWVDLWGANATAVRASDKVVAGETAASQPEKLRSPPAGYVTILADGRWMCWSVNSKGNADDPEVINDASIRQHLQVSWSRDEGETWSPLVKHFDFPSGAGMYWPVGPGFVDSHGNVHIFGLHYFGLGPDGFYDWKNCKSLVYHLMSDDQGQSWHGLGHCDFGYLYTGAVMGAVELQSGRLLVPISYYSQRPTGKHVSLVSMSDDGGLTWRPSGGECVVDTGGHLMEGGAIEPACVQLRDGRVWMLMRTQGGYLYEAFSADDGETWTEPVPSRFVSSNAPAALLRLRDGRLVVIWNNCMTPYHEGGIKTSYARHVLAGAISDNDGQTWHGYREFARVSGRGAVTYPFLNQCANGDILCQDGGLYRIPPNWLKEKTFQAALGEGLEDWMTLESAGVKSVPHPHQEGTPVLSLAKPDGLLPSAASLNFPFGRRGTLKMKIMLQPNEEIMMRQHVYFCLTDFFSLPRLPEVATGRHDGWGLMRGGVHPEGGRFKFRLAPNGEVGIATRPGVFQDEFSRTGNVLPAGKWQSLSLEWDCDRGECNLILEGKLIATLPQLSRAVGVCYLRLWMNAEAAAPETLLVESIEVAIDP